MELTEEQVSEMSKFSVYDAEISVRAARIIMEWLGPDATLADVANVDRVTRMQRRGWGRMTEWELTEVLAPFLAPRVDYREAVNSDRVFEIYRTFLANPVYNNMTYDGIARRACEAAETFQRVIGKRNQ